MNKKSNTFIYHGFTSLEMSIVLFISLLLLKIALLNLNTIFTLVEKEITIERLQRAIRFAQNEAFRLHKNITICGSHDQKTCHGLEDWSSGFIIFENEMVTKEPQATQKILQHFPPLNYGTLKYTAHGYLLHIHANGMTMNMGTFIYSPKNKIDFFAETALIVNRGCRSYLMRP